jgi:hypothetical protein
VHLRVEHHSLRLLCYQIGVTDVPPRHGNARAVSIDERVAGITQPAIRRVVARYLATIASTVRPKTVEGRTATLRLFAGWLADTHPEVTTLRQLNRAHVEAFFAFDATRSSHGTANHGHSVRHHHRAVHDLRLFFDDPAAWGWATSPPGGWCTAVMRRGCPLRCPGPGRRRGHRADARSVDAEGQCGPLRHSAAARRRAAPR